jgi:hypothetical protein
VEKDFHVEIMQKREQRQPQVGFRGSLELSSRGSLEFGSSGWLDPKSDISEASKKGHWMDISSHNRSSEVTEDVSSSEGAKASNAVGATTIAEDMMKLETNSGGSTRSTSLAKREC